MEKTHTSKLVLDLDNGPETSGQRSQWLLRMVQLAQRYGWVVVLAYYPPYPSKYNPIERCEACWRITGVGSCWTVRWRCRAVPRR
jgi:Rhodopirellula transposase DDE domain